MPGVNDVTPLVFVIARSASGVRVSVSLLELFIGSGSTTPGGTVTVAVLVKEPVAEQSTVAVRVKVAFPPAWRLTVVLMFPLPLAAPQLDPGVAVQVHEAPVKALGNMSVTVATGQLGPLFVTTMV